MSKVMFILPSERFRDEELFVTKDVLEKAGHKVDIASTKKGVCHGSRGGNITVNLILDEVKTDSYSAVVFVGGGGSKLLWKNETAHKIANDFNNQGKVVAAICLAPVTLAYAGLLKGKKATVAGTEAKTIDSMGATYTGPGVITDGSIVTANAPKASELFGQRISELLALSNT